MTQSDRPPSIEEQARLPETNDWLRTLRAEYGELTARQPVVGLGYGWQIACGRGAANLFAADRDLALGSSADVVTGHLWNAEAAIKAMRAMVARRDATEFRARGGE